MMTSNSVMTLHGSSFRSEAVSATLVWRCQAGWIQKWFPAGRRITTRTQRKVNDG